MFNFNFCLEVFGEAAHYLPGYPVLSERSLNKYPQCYNEKQHGQEEPQQYFFEFPQLQ